MRVQLQTPRRYVTGKGAPLHLEWKAGWGIEFIGMFWRAENYFAPVSNQNSIPRPSSPQIVTKPTELSSLHYLRASTAEFSVTINRPTCSLVLPHTHATTAQFRPEPTHFITPTFFIFEARYFSSLFSQPILGHPFVLG